LLPAAKWRGRGRPLGQAQLGGVFVIGWRLFRKCGSSRLILLIYPGVEISAGVIGGAIGGVSGAVCRCSRFGLLRWNGSVVHLLRLSFGLFQNIGQVAAWLWLRISRGAFWCRWHFG
jgi:hypothetical protein